MVEVQSAYKKRYNSSLEDEIKDSFTPEMSRLILKILHKRDENWKIYFYRITNKNVLFKFNYLFIVH